MKCKRCGSHDVVVQYVEKGQKTARKSIGLGGHINNTARGVTALCTFGVSNLVWKKSEGVNVTKTKSGKVAICQDCGKSWNV